MENGGLTQSIKILTEKVKKNPYFQYWGGVKKICSFSTFFRHFLTFDGSPNSNFQISTQSQQGNWIMSASFLYLNLV